MFPEGGSYGVLRTGQSAPPPAAPGRRPRKSEGFPRRAAQSPDRLDFQLRLRPDTSDSISCISQIACIPAKIERKHSHGQDSWSRPRFSSQSPYSESATSSSAKSLVEAYSPQTSLECESGRLRIWHRCDMWSWRVGRSKDGNGRGRT